MHGTYCCQLSICLLTRGNIFGEPEGSVNNDKTMRVKARRAKKDGGERKNETKARHKPGYHYDSF